jgi:hypothetical protein
MVWVILFLAWMIWARFGTAGLEGAATVGAMIIAGLGVRSFLDTFWKSKDRTEKQPREMNSWNRSKYHRYQRGLFYARVDDLGKGVR